MWISVGKLDIKKLSANNEEKVSWLAVEGNEFEG